jgi:hypothetical protein
MHPDPGSVAVEEFDTCLFKHGDDFAQRVGARAYRTVKALDALDGPKGDSCFCGQRLLAPSKKGARRPVCGFRKRRSRHEANTAKPLSPNK